MGILVELTVGVIDQWKFVFCVQGLSNFFFFKQLLLIMHNFAKFLKMIAYWKNQASILLEILNFRTPQLLQNDQSLKNVFNSLGLESQEKVTKLVF